MANDTTANGTNIDVERWRERSIKAVSGQPLSVLLFELLACGDIPLQGYNHDDVENIATKLEKKGEFKVISHDGSSSRLRVHKFGDGEKGRKRRIQYALNVVRAGLRDQVVQAVINPIRRQISMNHDLFPLRFEKLCRRSECVPPGQERIFAEGIVHFLKAEDIQATLVLFPYLESSLRYFIRTQKHKLADDSSDDDIHAVTLGAILCPSNKWRSKLEALISKEYVGELDLLLLDKSGPSLRNRIAHGNLPAEDFSSEEVVYGVWIIVQLVFASLVVEWNIVREALDR